MVHSVPDGTVHVAAQDLDRDGDLDVVLTIQTNFTGGTRFDQLMFMWVCLLLCCVQQHCFDVLGHVMRCVYDAYGSL